MKGGRGVFTVYLMQRSLHFVVLQSVVLDPLVTMCPMSHYHLNSRSKFPDSISHWMPHRFHKSFLSIWFYSLRATLRSTLWTVLPVKQNKTKFINKTINNACMNAETKAEAQRMRKIMRQIKTSAKDLHGIGIDSLVFHRMKLLISYSPRHSCNAFRCLLSDIRRQWVRNHRVATHSIH